MTIRRMDHVGIVVKDIAAATAFFVELGLRVEGQGEVGGELVDRIIGLEGVRSKIVMLATPDGETKLELSQFQTPPTPSAEPMIPTNVPGLRHLAFLVDDVDGTLERLRPHGAELVGTIENYENIFRLCYLRGPEGIIVELAEELG